MEQAISSGGMGESSNRHACAACKHQRRKCEPTCVLAPYFPAPDKNEEFLAVLKVFGVSNITKMLSDLDERDRDEAVESFTWEASAWMKDPVNGPLGLYRRLEQERDEMKLEIDRQKQQQQIHQQTLQCNSKLGQFGVAPPGGNTSEERQDCMITNKAETIPNYYYNLHQGQGVNCIAAPLPLALPQYTVFQGQGRGVPNSAQAVTLAVPGTAAEGGQRVVNRGCDSENIASIHPYICSTLLLEQERFRAASYNNDQGNNSYAGREKSIGNHCILWQWQGTPNYQRGGHTTTAQPNQGSSSYLRSSYRDHTQGPNIGQFANDIALQREQQQQPILNSNQFRYIQDQNKAWTEQDQTRLIRK